ncbi:MAG: dTDP-4-dehydrorhamnose reductase [Armatimonadetes bacterium]|nr:dTDP-4-dehydrorhamnose reductase [Armatimonadota bacterium]
MKVLVTGAAGMLGRDLQMALAERGAEAVATDVAELDIADPGSVAKVVASDLAEGCAWCVNCAAYTAVDRAESEPDAARRINALGPGYLAEVCRMGGMRLIHLSTDFVFDGAKRVPYVEGDVTGPLGLYGQTKLEGEHAILERLPGALIVRTAWLYGPHGLSFPRTILKAFREGRALRVVDDQWGTPTYTLDLARTLCTLMERDVPGGVYHAAGPECVSRLEWAERLLQIVAARDGKEPPQLETAKTSDFPAPAARPAYSCLSSLKLQQAGIQSMRPLDEALAEFAERLDSL